MQQHPYRNGPLVSSGASHSGLHGVDRNVPLKQRTLSPRSELPTQFCAHKTLGRSRTQTYSCSSRTRLWDGVTEWPVTLSSKTHLRTRCMSNCFPEATHIPGLFLATREWERACAQHPVHWPDEGSVLGSDKNKQADAHQLLRSQQHILVVSGDGLLQFHSPELLVCCATRKHYKGNLFKRYGQNSLFYKTTVNYIFIYPNPVILPTVPKSTPTLTSLCMLFLFPLKRKTWDLAKRSPHFQIYYSFTKKTWAYLWNECSPFE